MQTFRLHFSICFPFFSRFSFAGQQITKSSAHPCSASTAVSAARITLSIS